REAARGVSLVDLGRPIVAARAPGCAPVTRPQYGIFPIRPEQVHSTSQATTVKVHRGQVMRKMLAKSVAELVRMADRLGSSGAALEVIPKGNCRNPGCKRLPAAQG